MRTQNNVLNLKQASPKDTLLGSIAELSLVGTVWASAYTLSGVLFLYLEQQSSRLETIIK
tara:strand:- start:5743 stop:5922 length:180 start_codon:yes stop_codon:yes gene_type:complete